MLENNLGFSAALCCVHLQNRKILLSTCGSVLPLGAPFLPVARFHSLSMTLILLGSGCSSGVYILRKVNMCQVC